MRNPMAGPKKMGKVSGHDKAPRSVSTQPAESVPGYKAFETEDEVGDVPHFANNVGKSQSMGGGMTKHWSGK